MKRITNCFSKLKKSGSVALIPYITAGDPTLEITLSLMYELVNSGADLIELGIPFSDPMADGPVIQKASERALVHGTNLMDVISIVAEFRKKNDTTPVILMGYLNPIEILGYAEFSRRAKAAGVDGVLIVDLPPEEADDLNAELNKNNLDQIFLLSPTTTDKRLEKICSKASGFLYYVSLKGVTGSNQLNIDEVKQKILHIRNKTDLPVGVGFGIKDAKTATAVGSFCDAVIIGSALVETIANSSGTEMIVQNANHFISELRLAVDSV